MKVTCDALRKPKLLLRHLILIGSALLLTTEFAGGALAQQASGKPSSDHPAQFRVVRSMCGSKGISSGSDFQIQDPRNVFHVPEDHQIIVYFEWEGPPGSHHANGAWRSPDGKVVLNSEFDLASKGTRYIGSWTLAIPESIATGLWALEASIDGQPAGTQTFEIVSSRVEAPPAPAGPPIPTPAEVYQRAAAASVFVTSLDENGEVISRGIGFFIDKGIILTALQSVDGSSSVRIDLANGSHVTADGLVAWNRAQDWAILKIDPGNVQPLEKAPLDSWKVGDFCYILASEGQGSRTIQNVSITGFQQSGKVQRLTISAYGGGAQVGAPLLDSYGRVIGVLSAGLTGLGSKRMGDWTSYIEPGTTGLIPDPTVLPLAQIPPSATSQQPVPFADLAAKGELILPLPIDPQAASGSLSEDFTKVGDQAIFPLRSTREFSRKQSTMAVIVVWGPNKKVKGLGQLRIYDLNNQPVAETAPAKISLQPRVTAYSAWKVSVAFLPPGLYRLDLILDGQPQWRQFFRMVD
jgi:Trypsin-like peptidase domain